MVRLGVAAHAQHHRRINSEDVELVSVCDTGHVVAVQLGSSGSWPGGEKHSESRKMLEGAIEQGRGGVYLKLTPEQYARLRRPASGNP
jgi:hypothetical protein